MREEDAAARNIHLIVSFCGPWRGPSVWGSFTGEGKTHVIQQTMVSFLLAIALYNSQAHVERQ